LNIIRKYFETFQRLHACYAPDGAMSYPIFLQFCMDFRLTPELISREFAKAVYEGAQCVDALFSSPVRTDSKRRIRRSFSKSTQGSSATRKRNEAKHAVQSTSARPGLRRLRSKTFSRTSERLEDLDEHTDSNQELEIPASFGASAFIEAVFKLTFSYLGFFGNSLQQSTGAYARAVWTVSYLHFAFAHLQRSLQQRKSDGEHVPDTPLLAALQDVPLQNWQRPPPLQHDSLAEPMLQRAVMPAPGQGQRRTKRRRLNIHAPKLKPSHQTTGSVRALHLSPTDSGPDSAEEAGTRDTAKPLDEDGRASVAESSVAHSPTSSDEDLHEQSCSAEASPAAWHEHLTGRMASAGAVDTRRCSSKGLPPSNRPISPKVQDEKWPLEDLFKAESGLPTISNGRCILCGENTLHCPWGNPACRGCSFIDGSKLDLHPLKKIIGDRSRDISIGRPKATAAPHVRRWDGLAPPPFQSREYLRSQAGSARITSSKA